MHRRSGLPDATSPSPGPASPLSPIMPPDIVLPGGAVSVTSAAMLRPATRPARNVGEIARGLRRILGAEGVVDDPVRLAPRLIDERGKYRGEAVLMARPATTEEVAATVGFCAERRIAMVPQGGNTSMCGASVPHEHGREILIGLSRMNRIRAIDAANDTMTAEAGCVLARLQEAAAEAERMLPLSLAAEGSCEIGGNVSTNAGGTNVLRYGMARSQVLGLEVVLPDGAVWDGLRALRKDNTGYDLKQLFIGAEGTLGIVTAAVLKLEPKARTTATAWTAVPDPEAALALLGLARDASGGALCAFEFQSRRCVDFVTRNIPGVRDPFDGRHDWFVLIEMASSAPDAPLRAAMETLLEGALERGLAHDAVIAASEAQARNLWALREYVSEAQKPEGGSIKHDVSTPVSRVPEFLRRADAAVAAAIPGARPVAFGHMGDGNVHYNVTQPEGADREAFLAQWERLNEILHDLVVDIGGSFSAEHGIGRLKRDALAKYRSPVELGLMRRIKQALDPHGIMNPGKVV